jgi:hypothetical protein
VETRSRMGDLSVVVDPMLDAPAVGEMG